MVGGNALIPFLSKCRCTYVYFLSLYSRFIVVFHHQCEEETIEEPPFQYTATDAPAPACQAHSGNKRISMEPIDSLLDISMNLLQEGLETESIIAQFEVPSHLLFNGIDS